MRRLKTELGCGLCLVLAACTSSVQKGNEGLETIPVASAYAEGVKQLKVSDFLSNIRYVPLETNDSVLVGEWAKVTLLPDRILVTDETQALLFDRKDGHFLCKIGHQGNDPQGYSSPKYHFAGRDGLLYFAGWKDGWQRYDLDGKYRGMLSFSEQPASTSSYVLPLETGFVKYYNTTMATGQEGFTFYAPDGKPAGDTLALECGGKEFQRGTVSRVTVLKNGGNHLAENGVIILYHNDGNTSYELLMNPPVLWEEDGKVRAMEYRNDTIYTLAEGLKPTYCFDMGKWSASRQGTDSEQETLVLGKVSELKNTIFFECLKGLKAEETFYGIYHRKTGKVTLGRMTDKLTDDLTPFMPVDFSVRTSAHELAGLLNPADVLEWADAHGECRENPSLDFLKTLKEDDNPVVVIATE